MTKQIKRYHSENLNLRQKLKKLLPVMKRAGYFLAILLAAILIYELFFMVRITAGISAEKEAPKYLVTVEIVDASNQKLSAEDIRTVLNGYVDSKFKIELFNHERLDDRTVAKTLIITREKDRKAASFMADLIGMNRSGIVYRKPIKNDLSPSVTLVLGEDIAQLLNISDQTKEH